MTVKSVSIKPSHYLPVNPVSSLETDGTVLRLLLGGSLRAGCCLRFGLP